MIILNRWNNNIINKKKELKMNKKAMKHFLEKNKNRTRKCKTNLKKK